MKYTNARALAIAINKGLLEALRHASLVPLPSIVDYDPVVTLHLGGRKAPLWLVYPGVGEVLVFINLVRYLADDDRPIYALRARGFELG